MSPTLISSTTVKSTLSSSFSVPDEIVRFKRNLMGVSSDKPMSTFGLSEETPIRLRLNRTISSGTEKLDDKVDFTVVEDIKVGDILVVPQGATAIGTVTEV